MNIQIRAFVLDDYPAALALWKRTEGLGLNESDEQAAVAQFLNRNPDCSAVAQTDEGTLVGAMLCGHDGRRGSLHHLAVERDYRQHGLGRRLVDHGMASLARAGIPKCNIFILRDNADGAAFWLREGWYHTPWLNLQKLLKA